MAATSDAYPITVTGATINGGMTPAIQNGSVMDEAEPVIPALSGWGLVVTAAAIVIAAIVILARRETLLFATRKR